MTAQLVVGGWEQKWFEKKKYLMPEAKQIWRLAKNPAWEHIKLYYFI